jgi:Ca-activated chloride channel family protein
MPNRSRREYLLGLAAALAVAGCTGDSSSTGTDGPGTDPGTTPGGSGELIDDWQYDPSRGTTTTPGGGGGGNVSATVTHQQSYSADAAQESADVGFAAGGAKDVNNFRQNVEEDYLPLPTDVAYEGLFYDYYFDTGESGRCQSLFCPSYSTAVSTDPLSGETERYLTVGLNSGIEDFERKDLNLVVVLDISGSMSSGFGQYYYDQFGNKKEVEEPDRPKMDVATEAVADMTRQLRPADRFGVVLFDDQSHVAKPVRSVERTDMDAIRDHLTEVQADGGTYMAAGLRSGTELLSEYADDDPRERETRIVFVTDAMPNIGERSEDGLRGTLADNAEDGIYTTFVGVGVDFNTEIVDAITEIRGSNYYSVKSPEQFEKRLVDEFEYMVTPLVFDLSVELEGSGYEIKTVYGSTAADESTGEVLRANTLFPSPKREGETRGGVILAKVTRVEDGGRLRLRASWEDRVGSPGSTSTTVEFVADRPEAFDNAGIRKAVLLTRYADLIKNWTIDERERGGEPKTDGIRVPPETGLGKWERQSTDLQVSTEYRRRFEEFAAHFESEMAAVGDDELEQELEILRLLADYGSERLSPLERAIRGD